jgi:anti-sigma-K factor RskA
MTCEEFEELSGAYVLGAITPEERREAQAHLATCVKCSHLVQQLRSAASVLPLTAPQVTPSPALKERVMEAIRRENRPILLRPRTNQPGRRRTGWMTRLLAVAALLLLLLTGGMTAWNISLQHQVAVLQGRSAQLSSQVGELQQTNAGQSQQLALLRRQVARVYSIAGTHTAQTATGSLLYLPQQNIIVLVLHGLPGLKGTQVYQVWLLHGNRPVSIGLLSVQEGVASLALPGAITGYDSATVTQEPGPAPSPHTPLGPVVATAHLHNYSEVMFTI